MYAHRHLTVCLPRPQVKNTSDNATRRFVVGSYLMGRNNASAVYMSGVQDYGEVIPHRPEFDAPVGTASGPAAPLPGSGGALWTRTFSHAVVAVNTHVHGGISHSLPLEQHRFCYCDVYGHRVYGATMEVKAADAAILLRAPLANGSQQGPLSARASPCEQCENLPSSKEARPTTGEQARLWPTTRRAGEATASKPEPQPDA